MAINAPNPEQLEARRAEAWKLRVAGKSYRAIAAQLAKDVEGGKYDVRQAFTDVKAMMDRLQEETSESVRHQRSISLTRIDRAIEKVMPLIDTAEADAPLALEAMDRLDKLEKRRAALLGMDAPKKMEHSGSLGVASLDDIAAMRKAAEENDGCAPKTESD